MTTREREYKARMKRTKKFLREKCAHTDCKRTAMVKGWHNVMVCDLCSGFESWSIVHPKQTHCPYCSEVLILEAGEKPE